MIVVVSHDAALFSAVLCCSVPRRPYPTSHFQPIERPLTVHRPEIQSRVQLPFGNWIDRVTFVSIVEHCMEIVRKTAERALVTTPHADPTQYERLREFGAATVHEALGRIGAMHSSIKPLDPSMRVAGRALTVDCTPLDNLAIQYAVTIARPGDVLVVDAKAFVESGPWGDVLSLYAQQQGIAGLVIDGSVRDSRDIVEMGFPVFSRGVCIEGTYKYQPGAVDVPITCGGAIVNPGDIIIGDADGVVVVPQSDLDRAVELSAERVRKEDELREQLRGGAALADLLGLRDRLDEFGYERTRDR